MPAGHPCAIVSRAALAENICMIAKTILISGGFLVGLVCVALFAIALLYLGYCVVVGRLENRSLQQLRRSTPGWEFGQLGGPAKALRAGATLPGRTIGNVNAKPPLSLNRLH